MTDVVPKQQTEGVVVGIRIRPLLSRDLAEGSRECLRQVPGEPQVVLGADRAFTYNHVFNPQTTQNELFDGCMRPIVESVLCGYNATVLAYGQSQSSRMEMRRGAICQNLKSRNLV